MKLVFSLLMLATLADCKSANRPSATITEDWHASLSATATRNNSPSKLYVSWNPVGDSGGPVSHYLITATEADKEAAPSITTATESGLDATITGLKPATTYTISLKACRNDPCSEYLSADTTVTATTP